MGKINPIVLGVDPGTYITGFGVITQEGSRLIHIQSGSIQAHRKDPLEKRLKVIYDHLLSIIQNFSPTSMAIETIFYAKNVRSSVSLAHARGVALLASSQMSLPVTEYSPLEVKQAVVGYGRATKDQISDMVYRLLSGTKKPLSSTHDCSDALAVAICDLHRRPIREKISPFKSFVKELQ